MAEPGMEASARRFAVFRVIYSFAVSGGDTFLRVLFL